MAVTLKDVAAQCGLAVSTVSNILNDNKGSYASDRVKRLVKKTARDLGYRKHYLSVSLRTKKTLSVGLCLDFFVDETRRYFMNAFIDSFNDAGYEVAIRAHRRDPEQALASIRFFEERSKDGIVLFTDFLKNIGPYRQQLGDTIAKSDIKIMGIGSQLRGLLPSLDIDRVWAFHDVFSRFEQQGHKKVLVVYKTPEEFREGWSAIQSSRYVHLDNMYTFENFELKWDTVIAAHPDITAVFFRTDEIAIPALRFFTSRGITVPGDLAVCSFDQYKYSQYTTPPLTTYDINFTQLGYLAFHEIHKWITGDATFGRDFFQTIRPSLVERQSHRATPAAGSVS